MITGEVLMVNISELKEWNTFEAFKTPEDVILYLKVVVENAEHLEDVYYDVRRLIESYEKFKESYNAGKYIKH